MIAPALARLLFIALMCLCATGTALQTQASTPDKSSQNDPLARPKKKQKINKAENSYKKWRDEDVSDIITADELSAFNKLTNDAERASFVEAFWRRRDPTPDTEENEFKEEHYRRRAYADEHFSAGMPGSRTDRGRVYIIHGPPDSIEAHPAGGPYQRPDDEGSGQTVTHPFEIWRYRHIDGIGQEIEIEFVDSRECGAYHIAWDRGEKDVMSKVPNAGLTLRESLGLDSKANRGRGGMESLGSSMFGNNQSKEFDRMQTIVAMTAPPPVKFRDLKEVVDVKMRYSLLPFDVRIDFIKASAGIAIVPVTLQVANRDLTYVAKEGVQHASVNIYGRVTALSGKIITTFEDPLQLNVPAEQLEKLSVNVSLYQQAIPLHPGRYRLDLVLKDVNSGKMGTLSQSLTVPDFSGEEKLTASSLILADLIEPVPARETGGGPFVLGTNRVRPRVPSANGDLAAFKRGQKVNVWIQVYNLAADGKTGKPASTVEYRLINAGGQSVYSYSEAAELTGATGNQITALKALPPEKLVPGQYEVTITVRDLVAQQSIAATAKFSVQ